MLNFMKWTLLFMVYALAGTALMVDMARNYGQETSAVDTGVPVLYVSIEELE